jgi:hypothetical protein
MQMITEFYTASALQWASIAYCYHLLGDHRQAEHSDQRHAERLHVLMYHRDHQPEY